MLTLIEPGTPLSDEELQQFAELFQNKVPAPFLRFYREHNGGYLREEGEPIDPSGVACFIPIGHGRLPLQQLQREMAAGFAHLANYLPFADDAFGNCYLLSLADDDYGHVYLHLLEEDELIDIADSFEQLIHDIEQRAQQ